MIVAGPILLLLIICGLQSTTAFFKKPFYATIKLRSRQLIAATTSNDVDILRKVESWACMKNCGACCKLGPLDSRPDLQSYLTEEQYKLFVSMIGPDDWCKHFDKENRMCTIYENRPEFCRVDKQNFKKMFDIDEDEFSDFSTFCCRENIADVYGEESKEMDRFEDLIESLQEEEDFDEEEMYEIDESKN